MRTRDLRPGFFRSQDLKGLPFQTRILYAGLWCMADRRGRLLDDPDLIKADVLPFDKVPVEKHLEMLAERCVIERYEVDGNRCIWIPTFLRHQHPHPNEPESVLPPAPSEQLQHKNGAAAAQ